MIPVGTEGPARRPPIATASIVGLCILIFIWQLSGGPALFQARTFSLGMIPAVLFGNVRLAAELSLVPPWMTLLTSMFLHGGWGHLLGNMLYLWIFGSRVEDHLGHLKFVLLYSALGVVAAFCQALPDPLSRVPMVGASGAISGILGVYLVWFPRTHVIVFVPVSFMFIHRIQALWLLGFWILWQIVAALLSPVTGGGVAWWAHIGGFLAGMLTGFALGRPLYPARPRGPWG